MTSAWTGNIGLASLQAIPVETMIDRLKTADCGRFVIINREQRIKTGQR